MKAAYRWQSEGICRGTLSLALLVNGRCFADRTHIAPTEGAPRGTDTFPNCPSHVHRRAGKCLGISSDSGYDAALSTFAGRCTTDLLGVKPGTQENQQADSQLLASPLSIPISA